MKLNIRNTATVLLALCASSAWGQDALRSGYFLEGYINRHELNPAFAPTDNYITVPALGGFTETARGNVGLNTFLYPVTINGTDKLTTFMNPDIDGRSFLGKLKDTNHIGESFSLPLINVGFKALGGYNTIGLSVNADASVALPKDLFTFMKMGMTSDDTRYSFTNLRADASSTFDIALGHSRQIMPGLRIGAKVKIMLGVGNAHAYVDNFDARLSNDIWQLNARGRMDLALGSGFRMPTKAQTDPSCEPSDRDLVDWDEMKYDSFGLAGFGLGFDLGASWQVLPDLEVSASLRDLGFMSWSNVQSAATSQTTWQFTGFKDIALDKDDPNYEENKLGQQLDDLGDQLKDCFDLHKEGGNGGRTCGLGATLSIGALYTMPFYRNLKGGFLFTQRIDGPYSWTEGRLSANVYPISWFDASINVGVSSLGTSLGAMINLHPKVVNFFVGVDAVPFKYTPQGVPVGRPNLSLSFGFNWKF